MKTLLRTSLLISLILLLAGCSLPKVTPVATPTSQTQPTSTAPGIPESATPSEAPVTAGDVISLTNASQLNVAERTAISNVQGLVWSLDSQFIHLVSQNPSGEAAQVFSEAVLNVPSLSPDLVYAAPGGTQRLVASPDGSTLAVMDQTGEQVELVDAANKTVLQTLTPGFAVNTITFSPDGKTLALSDRDEPLVALFDVASGAQSIPLSGFNAPVANYTAGFFGSSTAIVWQALNTLQVQDVTSQTLSSPFDHEDSVDVFSLNPDGSLLAASAPKTINGALTPAVYFWDIKAGSLKSEFALSSAATALCFSPDGNLLAVATGDQIQLVDTGSQMLVATLTDNANPIYALAFSPDGRWLASAYADQLVLWTVAKP